MNMEGYFIVPIWIGTAVFVFLVSMVLGLMALQFSKAKWSLLLPVAAGVALSVPAALVSRGMTVGMFWYILGVGLLISCLGIRLAKRISKQTE